MDEELDKRLRYLRLWGMLAHWDEYLALAEKEQLSAVRMLRHVVDEEYRIRRDNARKLRLKRACLPEQLVIETFPFERQPKLDQKRILALYDAGDYLPQRRNIIWVGPTGCGKTGLAVSFLIQALERGYTGRCILFHELLSQLYASVADHSEEEVIKRFVHYDCLLIDEVGYVEVEPVQVGLFFTLMHRRHRRKSTLVTSNLGFAEWRSFLKNDHLAAALIDRLTENSHVINMKNCTSLRPKLGPES
jgi:DNA replication protein DnaC